MSTEYCPGSGKKLDELTGKAGWLGTTGRCRNCWRTDLSVTLAGNSWKHKSTNAVEAYKGFNERIKDLEDEMRETVYLSTLIAMFEAHNKNKHESLEGTMTEFSEKILEGMTAFIEETNTTILSMGENVRKIDNWQKQPWWKRLLS